MEKYVKSKEMQKFTVDDVDYLRKIKEPRRMNIKKVGYYHDSVNTIQLKNIFSIRVPLKSGGRKLTTFRIFNMKILEKIRKIKFKKNTKFIKILNKHKIRYYEDLKENQSSKISKIITRELKK